MPRYRVHLVCLLPLVAASYHTRPWQYIIRYYNVSYIPLGLRRTWCNGRMRRLGLITVRLPYLLPHCGFPFPASQLGKSYVRKKAMQWICRRFASPSSTALLTRYPGRIGSHTTKKDTPSGVPLSNQRLPILPGRLQPSTFGVYELNYCVRDGNRWILIAIATESVRVCTLKTT